MKNIINSFLAGVSISIGGFAYLSSGNKLIGALLFSICLFLICTMGYNLFTGKICYLFQSEEYNLPFMFVVLMMNFLGTFLIGMLTRFIKPELIETANNICATKLNEGWKVILLGILCNVLIFYAVYEYANNKYEIGKYIAIIMCVVVFILCGFEHCIANMYYFSVADYTDKTIGYILLNILGNALGGIGIYRLEELRTRE
jgi:formate/nitrite transporter FocA (FNT family)